MVCSHCSSLVSRDCDRIADPGCPSNGRAGADSERMTADGGAPDVCHGAREQAAREGPALCLASMSMNAAGRQMRQNSLSDELARTLLPQPACCSGLRGGFCACYARHARQQKRRKQSLARQKGWVNHSPQRATRLSDSPRGSRHVKDADRDARQQRPQPAVLGVDQRRTRFWQKYASERALHDGAPHMFLRSLLGCARFSLAEGWGVPGPAGLGVVTDATRARLARWRRRPLESGRWTGTVHGTEYGTRAELAERKESSAAGAGLVPQRVVLAAHSYRTSHRDPASQTRTGDWGGRLDWMEVE